MASNSSEVVYEASSEMDGDEDVKVVSATSDLLKEECTSKHDVFKTPARLIYTDDEGLLQIENNVLSELSQIENKISVVGICGLYRSGKSYLMNQIAGEKRGFSLGNTVESETKGIWIWCKKHPKLKDTVLVLVDTEGLNDPEKGDPEHDNNLFCLTLLICNTLIINVKNVFDYDTLDKLAFISTLADSIKVLDGEEAEKKNKKVVSVLSPKLVMCIRDFHLQNTKDTPDQYFAEKLKPKDSQNTKQVKYNETKKAIRNYFPKRKCFTIAQPALGDALQKIESLDDDAINPKFSQDMDALRKYIYDRKPKYICNASKKYLYGADLTDLITTYVSALRGKTPICFEDAYTQVSKQRNDRVMKQVMEKFKEDMKKSKTMKSKIHLQNLFCTLSENAFEKYHNGCLGFVKNDYETTVKGPMNSHHELMQQELKARCQELGAKKLSEMYDTMLKENKDIYSSSDGYERYERDMDALQEQFFEEMKEYDKDDLCEAFEELKKSKKDEKMEVYKTASEVKAQQNLRSVHDDIRKEMDAKNELTLDRERQKMDEYIQDQLKILRTNKELYDLIINSNKKNSLCSIL